MNTKQSFGDLMRKRGLTTAQLAAATGYSQQAVSKWREGHVASPSPGTVAVIAFTLKIPKDQVRALLLESHRRCRERQQQGIDARSVAVST